MRLESLSDMKTTSIMALVGGVASALAFFLPWYLFFSGMSLLSLADGSQKLSFTAALTGQPALAWLELVAALVLIVAPLLAPTLGKTADIIVLVGALIGLGFVLYLFIDIVSAFGALKAAPPGTDPNFIAILQSYVRPLTSIAGAVFLGVGFWLATVGYVTGLIAAIRALTRKPKANWVTIPSTEPEAVGAGNAQ